VNAVRYPGVMAPDDQIQLTDYSEDGVDLTLIRGFCRSRPLNSCSSTRLPSPMSISTECGELGGEKDRAVLPTLRRTLEEKKKLG
jgi:hypothetical protein